MRYWVPELKLGVLMDPQTALCEKFGGLPWGLPADRWPLCANCGRPQTHLATWVHHPKRLDLGKPGRVLMAFMCSRFDRSSCDPYQEQSGANAVLFLDAEELTYTRTVSPEPTAPLEIEAQVIGWEERTEEITDLNDEAFADAISIDDYQGPYPETKLGGEPAFQQPSGDEPQEPFRFLGQIGPVHRFKGDAPTAQETGMLVWRVVNAETGEQRWENPHYPDAYRNPYRSNGWIYSDPKHNGHLVESAQFDDAGLAYIFARVPEDGARPEGLFFVQYG